MNISVIPKEDGRVICRFVYDESTAELIIQVAHRDEARVLAKECGGRVAKCISSH